MSSLIKGTGRRFRIQGEITNPYLRPKLLSTMLSFNQWIRKLLKWPKPTKSSPVRPSTMLKSNVKLTNWGDSPRITRGPTRLWITCGKSSKPNMTMSTRSLAQSETDYLMICYGRFIYHPMHSDIIILSTIISNHTLSIISNHTLSYLTIFYPIIHTLSYLIVHTLSYLTICFI